MRERRQFVRLDTRLTMSYRVLPSDVQPQASSTTNLSGGGLCIFVHAVLNPGTFLQVDLRLPDREQPVSLLGEVVWCEQIETHAKGTLASEPPRRSVLAGVKYIQIAEADRQDIMRYVILNLSPPRQTP